MLMNFAEVDGVATRCLTAGADDAPALLLLHGQTMTADIWMRTVDALAADFRVVAVDMLGHGFTRPPGDPRRVDVPEKIAHLRALLRQLGIRRAAVSGSSYGGLIAAHLYLDDPEGVSKLVINGSGSCFAAEQQLASQMARIHDNYWPTLTTSTPEMWRRKVTQSFHVLDAIPPELIAMLQLCYAQPWMAESWDACIRGMRDADHFRQFRILDRLHEFDVDTLLVWGRQDHGGNLDSVEAAAPKMRARLVVIEECGHMPMLEHPDEYNTLLRNFLKE